MKIKKIIGREILDSRGNPTVEADVYLEDGSFGRASVPSGASTGSNEAIELRDGDSKRYEGKGVLKAVSNINNKIREVLSGKDAKEQKKIDEILIELDGTENKSNLGANAILAVSLAVAKASASSLGIPLYRHIRSFAKNPKQISLPVPMCNIINGGKHASGSTDIQEFMIIPKNMTSFGEGIRTVTEVFHSLAKVLKENNYGTTVGDEGGYAPQVKNGNREALSLIQTAIEKSGYKLGEDFDLSLDVAASELVENGVYNLKTEERGLNSEEMIDFYASLMSEFPIISIEDGLGESDWSGWKKMTEKLSKVQIVGDDLLVTNVKFLEKAISEKSANAILIKVNQIGTLTETIDAVDMAYSAGWNAIISHRSGETEDSTIAHIAVGLGTGQIKTGSVSRTDRTAKYNELLRIEEGLYSTNY